MFHSCFSFSYIPSSIHEGLLITSNSGKDTKELFKMVKRINAKFFRLMNDYRIRHVRDYEQECFQNEETQSQQEYFGEQKYKLLFESAVSDMEELCNRVYKKLNG